MNYSFVTRALFICSCYSSLLFTTPRVINPLQQLGNLPATSPNQMPEVPIVYAQELIARLKNCSPDQMQTSIVTHGSSILELARQLKGMAGGDPKLIKDVCNHIFEKLIVAIEEGVKALKSPDGQLTYKNHLKNLSYDKLRDLASVVSQVTTQLKDLNLNIIPALNEYYELLYTGITEEIERRKLVPSN